MDIATIIISSLILIAVGVGLFLNYKTNLKLVGQLRGFEEKINHSITTCKDEIINSNKRNHTEYSKLLENATNELEKSSQEKFKVITENIETLKTDVINKVENKYDDTKGEIKNSYDALLKETVETIQVSFVETQTDVLNTGTDIINKVVSSLKTQGEKQIDVLTNIDTNFEKVLNEIKNPLTLD